MIVLVVLFVVLALASLIASASNRAFETRRSQRLLRALHQTDRRIGEEAANARRAMNDAAGQSWRNQFE